jgi:WD40 repeat protein
MNILACCAALCAALPVTTQNDLAAYRHDSEPLRVLVEQNDVRAVVKAVSPDRQHLLYFTESLYVYLNEAAEADVLDHVVLDLGSGLERSRFQPAVKQKYQTNRSSQDNISLSADGSFFVESCGAVGDKAVSGATSISIWDASRKRGKGQVSDTSPRGMLTTLSPDGKQIVATGPFPIYADWGRPMPDGPHRLVAWDAETHRTIYSRDIPSLAYPPVFSQDGKTIVTAEINHGRPQVSVRDSSTGQARLVLPNCTGASLISPDGALVYTGYLGLKPDHRDACFAVYDTRSGKQILHFIDKGGYIPPQFQLPCFYQDISPDGNLLLTGFQNDRSILVVRNSRTGAVIRTITTSAGGFRGRAFFTADSRHIISDDGLGRIVEWDALN